MAALHAHVSIASGIACVDTDIVVGEPARPHKSVGATVRIALIAAKKNNVIKEQPPKIEKRCKRDDGMMLVALLFIDASPLPSFREEEWGDIEKKRAPTVSSTDVNLECCCCKADACGKNNIFFVALIGNSSKRDVR